MHKSGTTLVSELLHHSGVNMVEDTKSDRSYDAGDQLERAEVDALNAAILGGRRKSITYSAPRSQPLTFEQRAKMRAIIEKCNQRYDNWGFKDPKTCLTYRLWASELPSHRIIAIYRSPHEIWARYRVSGRWHAFRNVYLAWRFMTSWTANNRAIITALRDTEMPFIAIDYQLLMTTDTELQRLERFIGRKLQDRRSPDLYRSRNAHSRLIDGVSVLLCLRRADPWRIMEDLSALRDAERA